MPNQEQNNLKQSPPSSSARAPDLGLSPAQAGPPLATGGVWQPEPTAPAQARAEAGQGAAPQEARQARELRSEKRASQRFEARKARLGQAKAGRAMKKGKALAGRMARAAADSDWPYILAILACALDDFIDMADVSLSLGLDQLLDFILVLTLVATKSFIKNQPGWWQIRIGVFILELIPGVGTLPLWTIASIYSWQKAKRMRYQGQAQQVVAQKSEAELQQQTARREAQLTQAYRRAV